MSYAVLSCVKNVMGGHPSFLVSHLSGAFETRPRRKLAHLSLVSAISRMREQ